MTEASAAPDTDAYARLYEREHPRLVAYARTLTGNPWVAEDLVAEAHFRVWRRLRTGHQIDNVSAYLTTTVRHLSSDTAGRGAREVPRDPAVAEADDLARYGEQGSGQDPAQRVAYVDLLARVMGQLPERWVKALWLAEAEDQPLESVGRQIGANTGATAVLLHRAREGMRQAFLREQPGAPANPACAGHWERMPAHIRGTDSPRQAESIALHVEDCADCRDRLAVLAQANTRLPALVGPALLVLLASGGAKFLAPLLGAGAAGAGTAATAGGKGSAGGALRSVRHLLRGQVGQAGPVGVAVAGAGVVAIAAVAVAAGQVFGGSESAARRAQAPVAASSGAPERAPADPSSNADATPRGETGPTTAPGAPRPTSATPASPTFSAPPTLAAPPPALAAPTRPDRAVPPRDADPAPPPSSAPGTPPQPTSAPTTSAPTTAPPTPKPTPTTTPPTPTGRPT
ncbi:sigma-70 family RNA polymerase sigma factor, partial [Streptomyces buecherae]|uniref:sigma-70 family RNA polymerase sigma factor n=1 Tax=Streptomyces buecherae TaxID=2763006 RepID=UPI001C257174